MELSNLQTFVTVAETGSFSQTSEQLFLTQPAISKRIAALEKELGTRLFDRIGRHVDLTEAGTALLPRARQILMQVEDSRRAISNLTGQITGKLSIGTSHHIGLHRLPPILRQFSSQYPGVELDIHFMDSEEACQAVERGDLELGIVTLPFSPSAQLKTQAIWPDPLSIVIGNHHPLSNKQCVSFAQLCEHTAILPATGTYTREVLERALETEKGKLKVGLSTNYLETIKMMVCVGLGWSVLPNTMINTEMQSLSIENIRLHRTLGMIWHAGRTLSNATRSMVDVLSAQSSPGKINGK